MDINKIDSLKPTIIVPAYNEERNIESTLNRFMGEGNVDFNVIVVCNGCDDQTFSIVSKNFPIVNCLKIDTPSKSLAIQYAESFEPGFPRIYLDADIKISTNSINLLT